MSKHANEYKAEELIELAKNGNMRLATAQRLLAEETGEGGGDRTTVKAALSARIEELEAKAADEAASEISSSTSSGGGARKRVEGAEPPDPEQALVQSLIGQRGPTKAQQEGRTPTEEQVVAAKAAGEAPPQEGTFVPTPQIDEVQVNPHGPGKERAKAIADQVGKTIAEGEGPFAGTGVGKISPPAPAAAPGEPSPSGTHAAGQTARAMGAAPPAPTRFDGKDTGAVAPRSAAGKIAEPTNAKKNYGYVPSGQEEKDEE